MVIKTTISLSEWVYNDMISSSSNKSKRVEELIIKGAMYEKESNRTMGE